jgi:septum formation protein
MGFSFETYAPALINEEAFLEAGDLERSLQRLAIAKAKSVSSRFPSALVLGADTVVARGGKILGKPKDKEEARAMIRLLAGESHEVYSAVALVCEEAAFIESGAERTVVRFREIGVEEIASYIESKDCRDKAGAYAIQGDAMVFVDRIEGCYYNVVGLPVTRTISLFTAYMKRKEPNNV